MQSLVIFNSVKALLHKYDCVIIPNFGGFIAQNKAAYIDNNTHIIYPASKQVSFNAQLTVNDGVLATKISSVKNISYAEALILINKEVADLNSYLQKNAQLNIEKLGTFYLNENLVFTPIKNYNSLTYSFGLEPVKLNHKQIVFEKENTQITPVKTTKIIHDEKLVVPKPQPEVKTSISTSNPITQKSTKKTKRRVGFAYAFVSLVVFLMVLMNFYIFTQNGNLYPLKNKFDELNLGGSIISLFQNNKTIEKVYKNPSIDVIEEKNETAPSTMKEEPLVQEETKPITVLLEVTKEETFDELNSKNAENIKKTLESIKDNYPKDEELKTSLPAKKAEKIYLPKVNSTPKNIAEYHINLPKEGYNYIVAKAFNNETEAKELLTKLIEMGYPDAEIVLYNKAEINSLNFMVTCVKKSTKLSYANELAKVKSEINKTAFVYSIDY